MQFHENFKRIANEKGTSPTAVLRELGIAPSKVAMWNKGSLPKQATLVRLAEYLNCSVIDFFWDEKDDERLALARQAQAESETKDEDEEDILRIYRMLSRQEKHEFMAMVYGFEAKQKLAGDETSTDKIAK